MSMSNRDQLLVAATNALDASRALLEFWRAVDVAQLSRSLTPADVDVVERLIRSRVDVLPAFEVLVRCAPTRAHAILLERYLGKDVSPDTKHGGFLSELSSMLDDLVEIEGEESLRHVFLHVPSERLDDVRVLTAVRDALELASIDEAREWLSKPA